MFERVVKALTGDAVFSHTLTRRLLLGLGTYAVICFAWVFFRASSFEGAAHLIKSMVGAAAHGDAILTTREILQVSIVIALLVLGHWVMRDTDLETAVARVPRPVVVTLWTLMLGAIILTQGNGNAFIYFQF